MSTVTQILHESIVGRRGFARTVAQLLNKPYSTLLRELNPWDKGAKVGVDDLLSIIKVTNDPKPLEYMAETLGYRLVRNNEC